MSLVLEKRIKFKRENVKGERGQQHNTYFPFVTVWSYSTYVTVVTTRYIKEKKKKLGLEEKS